MFPVEGIVPTRCTQASSLLGDSDRSVLVAVLDTGVDPGAVGLQKTSDGRSKLVGILDTSGGGDVNMTPRELSEDGYLKLGSEKVIPWPHGGSSVHIGTKSVYELFPSFLVHRLKQERKVVWEKAHNECMALSMMEQTDFKNGSLSKTEMQFRNEMKARQEFLENASFVDVGPMVDIVAFKDKSGRWKVCIYREDDDSLGPVVEACEPGNTLVTFERHFAKWDESSQLNYGVQVANQGLLVTIVVPGSHGTHVASIIGGYHPEKPELNGVAPNVQILSIKIGDERLDSMETGASLIRALNSCVEWGVDIINLSFGEPTALPEGGRVIQLFHELVYKYGIICTTSNGNSGPALSTVGAPATDQALFSVGAYVEPDMMMAAYAIKQGETPPANAYTWSSRGPAYDGGTTPTLIAPGGAICSMPEYTLMQKRLMNGTSMSSPNAAGCIALLVMSLKSRNIKYSPWSIRRALIETACVVPGVEASALGAGLIQVKSALDYLLQQEDSLHLHLPFEISILNHECRTNSGPARGIYLREPWETSAGFREFSVQVAMEFPCDEAEDLPAKAKQLGSRVTYSQKDKNIISVRVKLCSSAPWVSCVEHILMSSGPSVFKVKVDLAALPCTGESVFSACIVGEDDNRVLFRVPVTVVRPLRIHGDSVEFSSVDFSPGTIMRRFVQVPRGATWMDVTVASDLTCASTVPASSHRIFYLHCLQMKQQSNYREDESKHTLQLRHEAGSRACRSMTVSECGTVEICLAQFWSSLGTGSLDVTVTFRGISPSPETVDLGPHNGEVAKVFLTAHLSCIRAAPTGKLTHWRRGLCPVSSTIKTMPRDMILGTRVSFGLELNYTFKSLETGKLKVTLPLLNDVLYDSPFDSQMIMIFDQNKKLLNISDAWGKQISSIPKGDLSIKALIRHENVKLLERLQDIQLLVERPLSAAIPLSVYQTHSAACTDSKSAVVVKMLSVGETMAVYIAPPPWKELVKSLPKTVQNGDILSGTLEYSRASAKDTNLEGSDRRPAGYPVTLLLSTHPQQKNEVVLGEKRKLSPQMEYVVLPSVKEKIKTLSVKDIDDQVFDQLIAELEALDEVLSDYFRIQIARAKLLRKIPKSRKALLDLADTEALISLADAVIDLCDRPDLLDKCKTDIDGAGTSESQKEILKENNEVRQHMVEACVLKIYAGKFQNEEPRLSKMADQKDFSVHQLAMDRHFAAGRFASCFNHLEKLRDANLESFTPQDLEEFQIKIFESLSWDHLSRAAKHQLQMNYPSNYPPF